METLGSRLKHLRNNKGLSLAKVAVLIGRTPTTIQNWENGTTRKPDRDDLEKVAVALGTSVAFLRSGKEDPQDIRRSQIADRDDVDTPEGVLLPVFNVRLSAGPGAQNPDFAERTGQLYFTRAWLRRIGARAEEVRIVSVQGDSMEPVLFANDKVAIHTGDKEIRDGHVYALAYRNEAKVKRLSFQFDDSLRISSDNPVGNPDEVVRGEDLNDVQIIGRIVHKMGEGGLHR